MRPVPLLLTLALASASALAGCATPAPAPTATGTPTKQYEDGVNKLDVPVLPRDPPADGERTLAAAPQWRLGEWWTYKVVDHFTEEAHTVTRVVAGTDGPSYLVGFPIDGFSNDILVLHIPGYGDVAQANLSFEVHDVVFSPLRFPLTDTQAWPTAFEGRPGNMTAEPQPDGTARLTGSGVGWGFTATYDPKAGEVTHLDSPGYATYDVTGHGYGYRGTVRVPHAHDLVFQHGRLGPVFDARQGIGPNAVTVATDTVQVQPGYDHLGFTLIVGNLASFGVGPLAATPTPSQGYYQAKATAPNGTAFELSAMPGDAGTKIAFYGTGDPTGPWALSFTVGGPGIAFAEGIGYHSIDVELPSGCVVASFNAQHHAAPCRVDAQGHTTTQASK
ncbi:MAG: hypothetical protein ABR586_01675 [Thermoplasmatota archaeon]